VQNLDLARAHLRILIGSSHCGDHQGRSARRIGQNLGEAAGRIGMSAEADYHVD
jgi:hypothetical protein